MMSIRAKMNDLTTCPLHFWRIYEMGIPQGSNMKAPRGFRNSLWSLFSASLEFSLLHKTH